MKHNKARQFFGNARRTRPQKKGQRRLKEYPIFSAHTFFTAGSQIQPAVFNSKIFYFSFFE